MSAIYGSMGEIARRLMELEEENARIKEKIRLLEQERWPRWMGGESSAVELYVGESDGAISLNGTGVISRWEDPWISMSNKYTDSTTNDTVRTIIGPIASGMPVMYAKFEGIEELIAIQSKCAT